jgi:hypothetical protein
MYIGPPPSLLFALAGVTIIVTRGTIFGRLQAAWPVFFRCALCVGFWVGAFALLYWRRAAERPSDFLLDGATVALLSFLADGVLAWLHGGHA